MVKQKTDAPVHHSFNVPAPLDARVRRCMALENVANFTDFGNRALTRLCRDIERDHGIDAEGRPVR